MESPNAFLPHSIGMGRSSNFVVVMAKVASSSNLHRHWPRGLRGTAVHPGRERGWIPPLHTCHTKGS